MNKHILFNQSNKLINKNLYSFLVSKTFAHMNRSTHLSWFFLNHCLDEERQEAQGIWWSSACNAGQGKGTLEESAHGDPVMYHQIPPLELESWFPRCWEGCQMTGLSCQPSLGIILVEGYCLTQGHATFPRAAHIQWLIDAGKKGQAPWARLGQLKGPPSSRAHHERVEAFTGQAP